jgi:hypothetical protein
MATPMIDDLELKAVQYLRQETEQDFARHDVPGLEGTLHQRLGRRSHRLVVAGYLLPATAAADLETLQTKAAAGAEVTFTADIATALKVDKMVIESFRAEQHVGPAGQIAYTLVLTESPPLPPPAEVSAFGGLGDFGVGDLGFDPGALGDVVAAIEEQAGALQEIAETALAAVDQLQALASVGDLLSAGNPVRPVAEQLASLKELGTAFGAIRDSMTGITG